MAKYFCVFDFETDGIDPRTCGIVELACVMLDPYNLEMVEKSEFTAHIQPDGINEPDYYEKNKSTIDWHVKNHKCSVEELLSRWKSSPTIDVVWPQFVKHVNKYNKSKNQYDAPIACGANIRQYDLIISDRLNEKYKISKLFNYEVVDLRDLAFLWLYWNSSLRSRSMDSLRKYLGMTTDNAHEALQDVRQEAEIISRFLKFHKNTSIKYKYFEGAFKQEENQD